MDDDAEARLRMEALAVLDAVENGAAGVTICLDGLAAAIAEAREARVLLGSLGLPSASADVSNAAVALVFAAAAEMELRRERDAASATDLRAAYAELWALAGSVTRSALARLRDALEAAR